MQFTVPKKQLSPAISLLKNPLRKIPIERKRPRRPVPLITLIRVQKDVTGNMLIKEKLAFLSTPVPGAN